MTTPDHELDARNLNCPLPILRAKKALNGMEVGTVLKIMATDPGSVKDFAAFANQTGNELLDSSEVGSEFHFLLRKA
ncbi:MAG: sulfurtransferase TusA family protein [Gammaproteobacteria bacterium]|nr:sulfurtransferase TusA family protein [Gammaproteobacteria bacterium]